MSRAMTITATTQATTQRNAVSCSLGRPGRRLLLERFTGGEPYTRWRRDYPTLRVNRRFQEAPAATEARPDSHDEDAEPIGWSKVTERAVRDHE